MRTPAIYFHFARESIGTFYTFGDTLSSICDFMKKRIFYIAAIVFTVLGVSIFLWFCWRGFFHEKFIDPAGEVSLEKSAWFGDFIGGCTGAIFALVGAFLLFETLRLQRRESYRQLFDNTFFGLLSLHRDIVSDMPTHQVENDFFENDFFSREKRHIQQEFNSYRHSIHKRKKEADDKYVSFYIQHKDKIAHYFRILYRLFCFIDDSRLNEEDKVKYAKMMRALLSESELFFLYYNAFTAYGKNFQSLINKYNLIKHLPKLEKLEFQRYTSLLEGNEKHSVELVLYDIRKLMNFSIQHIGTDTIETNVKQYLKGKYLFKVTFPSSKKMELTINIKHDVEHTEYFQQGLGLERFDNNMLICLFRDYLIDVMCYSSFCDVNKTKDILISYDHPRLEADNKTIITFHIQRRDNKNLEFRANI